MPMEMPPGRRKYQTEFTLIIVVQGNYILRAQDLDKVPADVWNDRERPCHLYVITRSPMMSIDPVSVEITDTTITGKVRIHRRDSYEEHSFSGPHYLGPLPLTWTSEWPYDRFAIKNEAGESVLAGAVAILGSECLQLPSRIIRHEILYVGQAFGLDGERTAFDRLKSHETLQRILGDQTPDMQVWLTIGSIGETQAIEEFVPKAGGVPDDQESAHVASVRQRIYGAGFQEKEAVALAEAGLIRAWQPEYNERLKHTFPARKHVPLATVRDLDMHGLIVEWHSPDMPVEYWVGDIEPGHFAFYGYEVHVEPGRAESLALQATERPLSRSPLGERVLGVLDEQRRDKCQ